MKNIILMMCILSVRKLILILVLYYFLFRISIIDTKNTMYKQERNKYKNKRKKNQ
jgi:hypothetical protein